MPFIVSAVAIKYIWLGWRDNVFIFGRIVGRKFALIEFPPLPAGRSGLEVYPVGLPLPHACPPYFMAIIMSLVLIGKFLGFVGQRKTRGHYLSSLQCRFTGEVLKFSRLINRNVLQHTWY